MYDVTKPWVEGTQNGAADTAGASWTNYNTTGPFPWGTAGASTTGTGSIDRDTLNLWSTTASSFTPTGSKTVSLNADGLTVVRRWLAGGANNGVLIQLTTSGASDTLAFDSREGTTPPVLSVTYCLGTPPSFTVTFDPNGGTGSMDPQTASVPTALTANTFTRTGYTFSGWNTAANGSGTPMPTVRPTPLRRTSRCTPSGRRCPTTP